MSLTDSDVTHLLLALVVLLAAAHALGWLVARVHQPRVAGEILGGLLLGPTVLGMLPGWSATIFQGGDATAAGLGIAYQLGLFLLMYCAGAELRSILARRERRATVIIALISNAVPFLGGLAFLKVYDTDRFLGPARNETAFLLVFSLAMAVTSIPVISRIMADLGILGTRFARIVLSVAVLEDLLVYMVLNLALALVTPLATEAFSLPAILGIQPTSALGNAYHVALTLLFLVLPTLIGPGVVQRLTTARARSPHRASLIAVQMGVMLGLTALAAFLGVSPIFGALVAGVLAGDLRGDAEHARQTIQSFAYAVFIPLYFAIVGLRLDLVRHFEPLFFLVFLALACVVKSASSYAAARIVGEDKRGAWNLAVALNARGGPGIVLASVAFDARIISEVFYTILVMVALITSVLAGSWLEAVLMRGRGLLSDDRQASAATPPSGRQPGRHT